MSVDPVVRDHQTWLGYLQPDGLVVSAAALAHCQVILPRDVREEQERFVEYLTTAAEVGDDDLSVVEDWAAFLTDFFGWPANLLHGVDSARPLPESLRVPLPEFGEVLTPSAALADYQPLDPTQPWLLLIQALPTGTDLDAVTAVDVRGWSASPTRRFERLLRETRVTIGL
ncbi:MAG: hypothetical protein HQM00_13465, partial [Magnetococcales bacterium]|nr:hypothetical protein [Magnetococcales bacterium]